MLHNHPHPSTLSRYAGEESLVWRGGLLLGTGAVGHAWVVTTQLSPDEIMAIQKRVAVRLGDIFLRSLGLFLVKITTLVASQHILRCRSPLSPTAVGCSIGLMLTVLLLLGAEGIFYGCKPYSQEPVGEEASWIRMPPPEEDGRVGVALSLPSAAFYVLWYPGVRRGKEMIPYFERTGVYDRDDAHFIDWPHPTLTLADGQHPTAQRHRTVAAHLATDLSLYDEDEER